MGNQYTLALTLPWVKYYHSMFNCLHIPSETKYARHCIRIGSVVYTNISWYTDENTNWIFEWNFYLTKRAAIITQCTSIITTEYVFPKLPNCELRYVQIRPQPSHILLNAKSCVKSYMRFIASIIRCTQTQLFSTIQLCDCYLKALVHPHTTALGCNT